MKKKLISILLTFLMLLTSVASASASVNRKDTDLISNMNALGIDKETQEKLLSKIKNGKLLDSMNPDVIPIIEERTVGKTTEILSIYPDGSRTKVTKILVDQKGDVNNTVTDFGNIGPMATIVYSTYQVKAQGVFIYASFWVDIAQNHDYNECEIRRAYSDYYQITSGNISNYSFGILSRYNPANAEMKFHYTIYNPENGSPISSSIFRLWTVVYPTAHYEYSSGLM